MNMKKSYLIVDEKIVVDLDKFFRPALIASFNKMKENGVDIRDVLATNITKTKVEFIKVQKVA